MKKPFIYGKFVEGDNFTDRITETHRLKKDFENGVNVIIISPRRMGKTSLVKKVQREIDDSVVKVVYMDIYDCRSEYDFYNKFAASLLKQTANRSEQIIENVKNFLVRLTPKIAFSNDTINDVSISLGITPQNYSPEEILELPQIISRKIQKHIVVCIDEFQQIGEFQDSLSVQKRMRSVWQLQNNVSYCLFGSKKHLLSELFKSKRMPFYQFGDTIYLAPIPTQDWVTFIRSKFKDAGMSITEKQAESICSLVRNHSSYVQQLSWNVMLNTERTVTQESIDNALDDLINQNSELFIQQISGLTSYQLNFLKAIKKGVRKDFTSKDVLENYNLGSKSNITRLINVLVSKELIEKQGENYIISDPILELWLD